jgi:hypothetical protein
MSKESDREVKVLQHIADEGEKYTDRISFKEFDEAMDTEWTRR